MENISLITSKLPSGFCITSLQFFIFVYVVYILYAIGATVVHTLEATRTIEAAKEIDLDSDLESPIRASFSNNFPSILVVNNKETMGGAFEFLIGCLKYYTVCHPHGTKA